MLRTQELSVWLLERGYENTGREYSIKVKPIGFN